VRRLNSQPQKEKTSDACMALGGFLGALRAMGAPRRYPTARIIVSSREITAITFVGA
jgi:hypothetical protein